MDTGHTNEKFRVMPKQTWGSQSHLENNLLKFHTRVSSAFQWPGMNLMQNHVIIYINYHNAKSPLSSSSSWTTIPAMWVFKPVMQILLQILSSHLTQNDILQHSMNSLNQFEIEEPAVFENKTCSSAASAPSAPPNAKCWVPINEWDN